MSLPNGISWRIVSNQDATKVKEVIFRVLTEYGLPVDPCKTDSDLDQPATFYEKGFFGVIENDVNEIVGTFGLLEHKNDEIEIRKMYLLPQYRGKGIGKFMMNFLLQKSKELGYPKVVLETASQLKEAVMMYEKYGFKIDDSGPETERCDLMYFLKI